MCSRRWRATNCGLRWTAVTIDNGDNAKSALDRITIPQEVLDRIAPTALPRSSIVISDEPLSKETNYRTEFVTVLSNQPQGGFITRKPTPPDDLLVAGPNDDGFSSFFQPAWNPQAVNTRRRGGQSIVSTGATALVVRRGTSRICRSGQGRG